MTTQLDTEAWLKLFKPVANHLDTNASWQDEEGVGVMFETYGEELEYVHAQPNENVWTYMDTNEGTILTAGYHVVNRIGYFITEVPWSDQDTLVIVSNDLVDVE